ncbi:MAG: Lrp/AsnC ligand binding domain-containing protein [Candidatus Poseidoniaceae archaeon]|jgi:DNA-binding Lrp family transcriptional regulator|nr:Lrp/AsnC ligand binding domain-containing protein [Candidatus Poseidoniaceae archaeon]
MPPEAFVLFKTQTAHEQEVYMQLRDHPLVAETHALYGEYDLIARVSSSGQKELSQLLLSDFRQIKGVKETQTLIAVDY